MDIFETNCTLKVLLAAIVAILILIVFYNQTLTIGFREKYRVKARAYYTCPAPPDCDERPFNKSQLLTINPFVWPYSGVFSQQEIITGLKPAGVIEKSPREDGVEEPYSHESLTNSDKNDYIRLTPKKWSL